MRIKPIICAFLALLITASSAVAAPHAKRAGGKKPHLVSLTAPEGHERISITLTQVNFPGLSERSSCRFLFRAQNQSDRRVALSTVLHTFDSANGERNSWLVPTGAMEPGAVIERLYSCKTAASVQVDQDVDHSWPRSCVVEGAKLYPCPVAINLASNLTVLTHAPDSPHQAEGPKGKGGH